MADLRDKGKQRTFTASVQATATPVGFVMLVASAVVALGAVAFVGILLYYGIASFIFGLLMIICAAGVAAAAFHWIRFVYRRLISAKDVIVHEVRGKVEDVPDDPSKEQ